MTAPTDRKALEKLMALALGLVPDHADADTKARALNAFLPDVRRILTAIEARECHVSPNEPTDEMLTAAARVRRSQDRHGQDDWEDTHPDNRRGWRSRTKPQLLAASAASPYRKDTP